MLPMLLAFASSNKIVAGQAIGYVRIGSTLDSAIKRLGKSDPSLDDAAMGHYWTGWKNGSKILAIYASRSPKDQVLVRIIHTNSSFFRLSNGLRVGNSWHAIHRAFPKLKQIPDKSRKIQVWDDTKHGIGFDIRNGTCIGIAVHTPGQPLGGEYLSYSADTLSGG